MLDTSTMLITVTGRKTRNRYTLPVSYVRDGDTLLVISQKNRNWWKNLCGGAGIEILLQGRQL